MPKTKKSLAAAGIREFSGIDERGYGFDGAWVENFKREFESKYKKFWAKRGIDSTIFRESNNSFFVPTK